MIRDDRHPTFTLDLDNATALNKQWNGQTEGARSAGEFGLRLAKLSPTSGEFACACPGTMQPASFEISSLAGLDFTQAV